jgi:hypothetical protein
MWRTYSKTLGKFVYDVVWAGLMLTSALLNGLCGGGCLEPFCARVGRNVYLLERPRWFWRSLAKTLDTIFFFDPSHCRAAFLRAAMRRSRNLKWRMAWIWQA